MLRVFRGDAIYLYTTRISAILLQSVSLFIIAAKIGVDEFGRFTFMFSASQIAAVLLNTGSLEYLQRILPARDASHEGKGNTSIVLSCFYRTFTLSTISLLALLSFKSIEIKGLTPAFLNEAQLILATGFLLSCLYISIAVVRVASGASHSMLLRDLFPYLFFLAGFFIAEQAFTPSADDILLIFCASLALSICLSIVSGFRYLQSRKTSLEDIDMKENSYRTFWGSSIVGASFSQADIFVARIFLDNTGLGIYSIARRVSNLVSMPQIIANWTINISVARDFELNDINSLQEHAKRGLMIAAPLAIFLAIFIVGTATIWLPLFHVPASGPVYLLLLVLLLAQLINVLAGANLLFAAQCRQELYALKSRLISFIFGVILMTLGAIAFASAGIAIGVLAATLILNTLVVYHVWKTTGVLTSIPLRIFKK